MGGEDPSSSSKTHHKQVILPKKKKKQNQWKKQKQTTGVEHKEWREREIYDFQWKIKNKIKIKKELAKSGGYYCGLTETLCWSPGVVPTLELQTFVHCISYICFVYRGRGEVVWN